MCRRARRVARFYQVTNKRNQTSFACLEELQEGKVVNLLIYRKYLFASNLGPTEIYEIL